MTFSEFFFMKFLPGGKKRAARRFLFIITASGKNEKRLTRILQKSAYFCFFPAAMREIICAFEAGGTEKRGAKAILYGNKNTKSLLEIHPEEPPVSLQLFGSDPVIFSR